MPMAKFANGKPVQVLLIVTALVTPTNWSMHPHRGAGSGRDSVNLRSSHPLGEMQLWLVTPCEVTHTANNGVSSDKDRMGFLTWKEKGETRRKKPLLCSC